MSQVDTKGYILRHAIMLTFALTTAPLCLRAQEPVESGEYYLIQNENNDKMYYLLPASHQFWQGNTATPYLRTAMTARETSVFRIERDDDDDKTCYRFTHAVTGKYIVWQGAVSKDDGAVIHLETIADLYSYANRDNLRFRLIKSTNNNYAIVHYGLSEGTGENNSWNPFGTNDHTTRGRIGIWKSSNDASSRWLFVKTTAPVTVSYNSGGSPTFTATCTDGDATLYYTTDGSDPTTSATRQEYSSPVPAVGVGLFRATAVKPGCQSVVYDAINTDNQFLIEHMQSPGFYLLPHSDGSKLNVNSLARPSAAWTLEDAGTLDGIQYFYLHLADASVNKYLHYAGGNGGALTLKATNDGSNNYKFRFDYDSNSGTYHICPMVNPSNMLRKKEDNDGTKTLYTMAETDVSNMHKARQSTDVQWKLLPMTSLPVAPPFDLSDNTSTHAYRIKNAASTSYCLIPPRGPVGNIQYATSLNNSENYTIWLFKDAGSDQWLRYYYIVNAFTGQYLYYREAVSSGEKERAFNTKPHTGSETGEEEDRFQFAVANTVAPANSYYLTPKLMRYENDGVNYRLIRRDSGNPLKLNTQRSDNAHKWIIDDAGLVAPPVITMRASDNKVVFTCATPGVTFYYNKSNTNPTTSSTAYTEPFDIGTNVTTIKAIAVKDGVSSVVTTFAVSVFTGSSYQFRIYNNESSYFFVTSLGNTETEGARVTTTNLPEADISWHVMDGGIVDGVQYYHFVSDTDGSYMACDNDKICMKSAETFAAATGDDVNKYRFRITRSVTDTGADATGFMILPFPKPASGFRKVSHDNTDPIVLSASDKPEQLYNDQSRWRFAAMAKPYSMSYLTALDASLVTGATDCPKPFLVQNKGNSSFFLTPDETTGNPADAVADGSHQEWYIVHAGNDSWSRYYYLRNCATDEYLSFSGTAGQDNVNGFTTVTTGSPTDACKFMIVKTANPNGETSYNIVPKALKNLRNQARISMHTGGSNLSCGNSRNNANAQWMFVSTIFLFAPPVITKDEETSTITITAEAGATIRYAGYDVPSDEPELTPSSGGSVYSAPFTSTHLYYKAIAYRCTDESDVSDPTIFGRTASPVITYDYSTELVTIECATAGATIYYTTNGDTPTTASTQYTAPFTLSRDNPVVIKAIAVFHNEESDVAIFNQMPILVVSSDDITDMTAYYLLSPSFTASEPIGSEASPFMGTIDGDFNDITLSCPLVAYAEDATIKNVVVASATVSGSGNIGALVCEAAGTTHIYNCGVLSPYDASTQQFTSTSTVSSSNAAAGGLVGHIAEGSQVRVVNCYSYANVSGSTHAAGIVGNNEGTVGLVRIANCMMYGKLTGGTVKSPVYAGNHISNVRNYSEYNYWRYRAYTTDETPYTAYNDQLAIADDRWLTRFPFYRHIQNTHRELAAFFLFGNPARPQAPSADKVAEIGHWVLKPNVAPYPIIEEWKTNTAKTTVDINANLPNTKARYAGKKLDDITGDMVYRGDGTQVTSMGSGGMLTVNYTINDGTTNISGSVSLPITDMDTLRYDYTWGKVVLPFANEFSDWRDRANPDYSKVITGWKITSVTGGTAGALDANYNFADRDCTAKDIYHATNNPYVFAQGGNYIVPYGVTSISVEANFAKAFYLSDGRADFGYDASYKNQVNLGWSVSSSYHGQTVYTSLVSLVSVLSEASNPNQQAIVLVGNYHYNQGTIGGTVFATNKAVTIMSVDDDNNQEPDYGWYSFHSDANRSKVAPMRFDFVPNIGMGMATRVTGSTPNPSIGIWHLRGWFETTETALCHMNECEINSGVFNADDNGHGNNRWVINSGFFKQIIRGFEKADNRLSYVQIGGNAYVEQYYPSDHITKNLVTKLRPTIVTGGEIEDCFMTGNHGSAEGSNIQFWCAGGKIHKYLSAFTTNPTTDNVNVTAKVDHALISRFFGGGTSASARITGDINVTMNNSKVDFYCGGPEFGDMSSGKAVTTTAKGTTFGEYYGAGFGGTSLTTIYKVEQSDFAFPSAISEFPITWDNYLYLTTNASNGLGVGYTFDYILYAGGTGTGVARFYNKFARFSLATTGNVTNTLLGCTVLGDFYGAGCQGKVSGTVTSTLTDCAVNGNAYGGGYKATNNKLNVYPNTQPAYSSYYKEMGLFSDFGTVTPEEWEWVQGALDGKDEANHKLTTNVDLTTLGNVTGAISLTIDGDSEIGTPGDPATGNVFGGGNESRSLSNATVRLQGNTLVRGNVYGGGNKADVEGSSKVEIPAAPSGSGD